MAQRILDPDKIGMWNGSDAVTGDNLAVSYGYRNAQTGAVQKWSNSATSISQVLATADSSAALTGSEANGAKVTFDVTASVAAWVAGTTSNQGWAITANTATGNPIYIYDSANATDKRPVLTITYTN